MSFSDFHARGRLEQELTSRGWTEELVSSQVNLKGVAVDYLLSVRVTPDTQPFPVAIVEIKGAVGDLQDASAQIKRYERQLNLHLGFATNGFDYLQVIEGKKPLPIKEFPTPDELRALYEASVGFSLDSQQSRPLVLSGHLIHSGMIYFQFAVIRAVLEQIARGETTVYFVMAPGTGRTSTMGELLKLLRDGGVLKRALFLTERREIAEQATESLRKHFADGVALVGSSEDLPSDLKVMVASGVPQIPFPASAFSHIILDDPTQRSAYGAVAQYPGAVVVVSSTGIGKIQDLSRLAGAPAYQFDLISAMEEGYLSPIPMRHYAGTKAPDPEALESMTRDFIIERLTVDFFGHPLADLVADLLRVMGYKTKVSPPGPDGGVDIIAHKDHFGIESPLIKVQVKSSKKTVSHADVASLCGNTSPEEFALFVTLGTFSSQSRYYARGKSNLRLMSGTEFVELLMEYYESLDARFKASFPMKRVYIPLVFDNPADVSPFEGRTPTPRAAQQRSTRKRK